MFEVDQLVYCVVCVCFVVEVELCIWVGCLCVVVCDIWKCVFLQVCDMWIVDLCVCDDQFVDEFVVDDLLVCVQFCVWLCGCDDEIEIVFGELFGDVCDDFVELWIVEIVCVEWIDDFDYVGLFGCELVCGWIGYVVYFLCGFCYVFVCCFVDVVVIV